MGLENVAILFTDMVGSTAQASELGPDAADELRRIHYSILRQAIAETGGSEVKNLGDGLMVVFASASSALSCAVAMQQGVDRANRDRPETVGLRVGLSCGEVSFEDDDYFGDPVIEAARLCALCEGGQILGADLIRLTAGRRSPHVCRSIGPLSLKGLPDPVDSIEVEWVPVAADQNHRSVPLPGRLALQPAAGVVGRQGEIEQLRGALGRVIAGSGRSVLLVAGEPGQGKTTLVAEGARSAYAQGACVLFGHCEEDLATPYQLFAEALGHFVTHAPDELLRRHVDLHGSELSRLVGALSRRLPDLPASQATDSDTERYLLFASVAGLVAEIAVEQPIVLVLDDLQWADTGSLQMLKWLATADPTLRLMVLGTYRDNEVSHAHALRDALGVLRRQDGVETIKLGGLDDAGVRAILDATSGPGLGDAGAALAHAVHRETDGNPFFVSEVLRHLVETGAIGLDEGGALVAADSLLTVALPDSVREVIGGRVVRLGPEAERVLSVAAVIGRDFDLDLLARATAKSDDELLDILDAATVASLVREVSSTPGHYNFAHALIQHTLYEDLGPTRRARQHLAVGLALEELCGNEPGARIGELARHFGRATQAGQLPTAIRYAKLAGDAALAALAPADALRYYADALELVDDLDVPDRTLGLDLAIGLGKAQRQTGDPAFRETLLDAAHQAVELGEDARLVAAALANDRGYYSSVGAIDEDKVAVLEQALERSAPDSPERAMVLATLCSEIAHGSPLERRRALADEAVAMARKIGDDGLIIRVLNHVYVPLQVPSLLETALLWTTDSLERAERLGDPVLLFWAAMWRAETAGRSCDVVELDRCLEIQGRMAARVEQPLLTWDHTYFTGMRAQLAGDTERAEELANEALSLGSESGQPDAAIIYGTQLMTITGQRGTMGDLTPLIERIAEETPNISPLLFGALLAKAHVEADRFDEARAKLEIALAAGFDLPQDQVWITSIVDYADATIECDEARFAHPLYEKLAPFANQMPLNGASALSPIRHYLGGLATVLGHLDEADEHFARAAAICQEMGAGFFSARNDLLWGRLLLRRSATGDPERAKQLLESALGSAAAKGYAVIERRAARCLAAL